MNFQQQPVRGVAPIATSLAVTLLATVLSTALLLAGCGRQREAATQASSTQVSTDNMAGNTASNTVTLALEPNTVTIGYLPSIVSPQPLIGIQEGEFTRRISGVAFKDKVLASDSAVLSALRAGTVDIAYTGTLTALKAYLETKSVVLLGACSSQAAPSASGRAPSPPGASIKSVYLTTKQFVQANPNFVRRFVEANRALTTDLNASPTKAVARVTDAWSKASGKTLDPAVAATTFKTIRFTSDADLKSLERDAARAVQTGALPQKDDLTGFLYDPSKP